MIKLDGQKCPEDGLVAPRHVADGQQHCKDRLIGTVTVTKWGVQSTRVSHMVAVGGGVVQARD